MNKVQLIGFLGADPEIRRTQEGNAVANLRIATSESWRDKATGEKRERTEWHRVVIFNENLIKVVEQYTKKGSRIYVEGQLRTRKWQDASGQDRYSTEVVLQAFNSQIELLDRAERAAPSEDAYGTTRTRDEGGQAPAAPAGAGPRADMDDEIPF